MSRKPTIYTSVDELPDLNSGSQQQYNSVDELPDLKKKFLGVDQVRLRLAHQVVQHLRQIMKVAALRSVIFSAAVE